MVNITKERKSIYERLIVVDDKNKTNKIKFSIRDFTASIPLFFVLTFLVVLPTQGFSEEPVISFENGVYDPIDRPVIITINDATANVNLDEPDTILVEVTSTSDPQGISLTLQETGNNTGVFKNKDLAFMDDNNLFFLDDGVTAFLEGFDFDSNSVETLENPLIVFSTPTDEDGLVLFMTETSTNSGRFEEEFSFTSENSHDNSLHAKLGDIISASFSCDLRQASIGLIVPNPDPTVGAIKAPLGDTVTATYQDQSAIAEIQNTRGCGGSGGGLVISRVVLDFLAGGTTGDFNPPQLAIPKLNLSNLPLVSEILNFISNADPFTVITPLDEPSIDYPISINGNGYLLTQYANTIQTYKSKTGEPVSFKMTLFDATGIEHIGLYTNLRGDQREVGDSDTYIIYNEGRPLEVTDPHGFFSNVNFTESKNNGKYIVDFNMTFVKPMDTSDVIIRAWDKLRNSGDIKVFDAIKIEGEPILTQDTNDIIVPDSAEIIIPYYKMPYYEIHEADSDGNLVYYNSFGGLEEKQAHPYYNPIIYPDSVGRNERHDNGFYESVINEETRAQIIVQSLIGNPFSSPDNTQHNLKFYYPSNVGKLDRENKEVLKVMKEKENEKAGKYFRILYIQ